MDGSVKIYDIRVMQEMESLRGHNSEVLQTVLLTFNSILELDCGRTGVQFVVASATRKLASVRRLQWIFDILDSQSETGLADVVTRLVSNAIY